MTDTNELDRAPSMNGTGDLGRLPAGAVKQRRSISQVIGEHWPAVMLALLIVVFSVTSSAFLTRLNWVSTSVYASSLVPLCIGELLVMLTAGIDLSIAGTASFSAIVTAYLLNHVGLGYTSMATPFVAAASCVVVGGLIGSVNGLLIGKLKLPPFIVTLGTLEALSGGVDLVNHGLSIDVSSERLSWYGNATIGGWISPLVLTSAVLLVMFGVMLAFTRLGSRTYAIGSNPEAVRKLGIPSERIISTNYALSGALGGVAGLFLIAQFTEATTAVDTSSELTAIAAVVIGGASLFGGRGTMIGTLTGLSLISVLLPGLVLSGLSSFWQSVVTGIVIIIAIAVEELRSRPAPEDWFAMFRKNRGSTPGAEVGSGAGSEHAQSF